MIKTQRINNKNISETYSSSPLRSGLVISALAEVPEGHLRWAAAIPNVVGPERFLDLFRHCITREHRTEFLAILGISWKFSALFAI